MEAGETNKEQIAEKMLDIKCSVCRNIGKQRYRISRTQATALKMMQKEPRNPDERRQLKQKKRKGKKGKFKALLNIAMLFLAGLYRPGVGRTVFMQRKEDASVSRVFVEQRLKQEGLSPYSVLPNETMPKEQKLCSSSRHRSRMTNAGSWIRRGSMCSDRCWRSDIEEKTPEGWRSDIE